jgi:hypothetical protein
MIFLVAKSCLALDANTKPSDETTHTPPGLSEVLRWHPRAVDTKISHRNASGHFVRHSRCRYFATFTKALRGLDQVSVGACARD